LNEIERCHREIDAMRAQAGAHPAWLVTLGIEDWLMEIRLIEAERGARGHKSCRPQER
jgi:hypothetical protein